MDVLSAPATLDELLRRAGDLTGKTLDDVARDHGLAFAGRAGVHTKGKTGELIERVLGASGGSNAIHDFPALGVELKTIPVSEALRPRESTYVCTLALADADRIEWETSWVRAKLAQVLWVPIVVGGDATDPRVAQPRLWRPTREQLAILAADFDEAMGTIALGGIDRLTARTGRWLQVRPKGASSRDRTWSIAAEDSWVEANPRGFYLRTKLTGALLRDLEAVP